MLYEHIRENKYIPSKPVLTHDMSLLKFKLNMENGFLINPSFAVSKLNNEGDGFLGASSFGDIRFVMRPNVLSDRAGYDVFDRDCYSSRVGSMCFELDDGVTLSHVERLCDDKYAQEMFDTFKARMHEYKHLFNTPSEATLQECLRQFKSEPLFGYLYLKSKSVEGVIENFHGDLFSVNGDAPLRDVIIFVEGSHVGYDEKFEVYLYELLQELSLSSGMELEGEYLAVSDYLPMRDLAEASCECLRETDVGSELMKVDDQTKMFSFPDVLKRLACTTKFDSIEEALGATDRVSSLLTIPSQESSSLNSQSYVIDAERRIDSCVDYLKVNPEMFMRAFTAATVEELEGSYRDVFEHCTNFGKLFEDLVTVKKHYQTSSVPYFEVKFKDLFNLNADTIDHIAVPLNLESDVRQILENAGVDVPIVTHNGTRRDRTFATVGLGGVDELDLTNSYFPSYREDSINDLGVSKPLIGVRPKHN